MPWDDVAVQWERRSGEQITGERCSEIAASALGKLRRRMARMGVERLEDF